jgi:cyclic-di-GMP phosphodiesterase TipF (flagellum assembly factor)
MRPLTSALLISIYAAGGVFAASVVWLTGDGWAPATAVGVAVFAAALAAHGLRADRAEPLRLQRELYALRDANRLLADVVESHEQALSTLQAAPAARLPDARTEALSSEVRVLEQLVERMGETMEARLRERRAEPEAGHPRDLDQRAARLEVVRDALAHNRVDLYLQPVVGLPQRRTVFYESFSRLRDESGRVMMPAEYLAVAEPEGLVTAIDNLLLFRCVQIVRRLAKSDRKVGIFCNIALASLGDESFFPQFLQFLSENRDLSGALIFELGQSAYAQRGAVEARNMAKLADIGFRFSLDKVSSLELDLLDLQRSDVKFLKISAQTLLEQLLEQDGRLALRALKDIAAQDFAGLTRRYGVEVIAEKVESERQVIDVLELDIAYGQGHLFGEPRAIREAVLAETDPPADFLQSNLRRHAAR